MILSGSGGGVETFDLVWVEYRLDREGESEVDGSGKEENGRTGYDLHPFNVWTTEVNDVGSRGVQRPSFEPEYLVHALVLRKSKAKDKDTL